MLGNCHSGVLRQFWLGQTQKLLKARNPLQGNVPSKRSMTDIGARVKGFSVSGFPLMERRAPRFRRAPRTATRRRATGFLFFGFVENARDAWFDVQIVQRDASDISVALRDDEVASADASVVRIDGEVRCPE